MKLNDIYDRAKKLSAEIEDYLNAAGYDPGDGMTLDYDHESAEECYICDELHHFTHDVYTACNFLNRLKGRTISSGELVINDNGRYELNGRELTCGSSIEFLSEDGWHGNRAYWKYSTIEAKDGKYFLTAEPETDMECLEARIKDRSDI